jgi:hypothetical protein|nr:hypothetical protein [Paraburkholderia caribensis]
MQSRSEIMRKPPPLNLGNANPGQNGVVDAQFLIAGINQQLAAHTPPLGALLKTFTGNFQQLSKCEMGTQAFQQSIAALPPCFLNLAVALNDGNAINAFINGPGWVQMTTWLTNNVPNVVVPGVVVGLLSALSQALRQGNIAAADHAATQLLQQFLLPILGVL